MQTNKQIIIKLFFLNKHQHLKQQVLCGRKADGGFDMLDFFDVNNTFNTFN